MGPRLPREFTVQEFFGVAHPEQVVDFDLDVETSAADVFMLGPDGADVPFQLIEGGKKVAVRTDLPAGAKRTWKLMQGHVPAPFEGGVVVEEKGTCYEVTNGLTGLRVPLVPANVTVLPAPLQAIRHADGTWTGEAVVPLRTSDRCTNMDVRFVERGPLKVVIEVAYTFQRGELRYGNDVLLPAGDGFYRSRIELQAGQPSILIEDESDTDVAYQLNCWNGLGPDQARYRGHHSSRKEHGYEQGGGAYRMWHERPALDAFFDLPFDRAHVSSYCTNLDKWPSIRRMAVWDPWVFDSGWYWVMYDSKAGDESNVLGIFAGRASRALGAANSGAGIFTAPAAEGGESAAGIAFQANRRSPDARVFPRVRVAWGIYVGTKANSLAPPAEVQPIAQQMNLHAGVNLNKLHRLALEFPDPPQGYGAMFMPAEARLAMIEKLRADKSGPHGGGFHSYLYNAEPYSRPLIDFWHDTSGQKAREVVGEIAKSAADVLDSLVHGDGIYSFEYHYWHGGLEMSRKAVWIDQVLASQELRDEERARMKACAALFGAVLWDDDFVPLFEGHGLNLGTPNMPVQQWMYRNEYVLMLARHPMMVERARGVWDSARKMLHATINQHGAHMGSVHYVGAANGPLLTLCQQLKMTGLADVFRTEPRLAAFSEFYMNFMTPPEPRFGGVRKLVAIGDGSTESTEEYGQLATAFADVDARLSAQLMRAWRQCGSTHSGFHGTTLLKIDERLPGEDAALESTAFPGWCSVLRYGWGTPNETAVWLVDGNFYSDHYHNDLGSVVIYALGAPLSVDWGPIYYPRVAGALMHNVVVPESAAGHPWNADNTPLDAGARWRSAEHGAFLVFYASTLAQSRFTVGKEHEWTRSLLLMRADENRPLILIRDTFGGEKAGAPMVFTLNLMADGDVDVPGGKVTPPARSFYHDKQPQELPSAGQTFSLAPGVHRLGLTGQWLIDWDMFVVPEAEQQACIGNWAHHWHPSPEQAQFRSANGREFEERQHILRLRGSGPFTTLIAPYRKGERAADLAVHRDGDALIVATQGATTSIRPGGWSFAGGGKTVVAALGEAEVKEHGVTLSGGPQELVIEGDMAVVTAHGPRGVRRVVLPGKWNVPNVLKADGEGFVWNYLGGWPMSLVLEEIPE